MSFLDQAVHIYSFLSYSKLNLPQWIFQIKKLNAQEWMKVAAFEGKWVRAGTTAIYVWIYLPRAKVVGDDSTAFLYLAPLALRTLRVKDSVMIIVAFFLSDT